MGDLVDLNKISTKSNVRTEVGDMQELMTSIKQNGLLQPIGLWKKAADSYVIVWGNRRYTALRMLGHKFLEIGREAVLVDSKEMSEDKYLIMNTIENIQRKDVTPAELGRIVEELKKSFNMSYPEVASRLGVGMSKVNTAVALYKKIPANFQNSVGFVHGNTNTGLISADAMKKALQVPIPKEKRQLLFNAIKRENMSADEVVVIRGLVENGMKIEDAIKTRLDYRAVRVKFTLVKKVATQLEVKHHKTISTLIYDAIRGKVKLPANLIYFEKAGGGV